MGRFSDDLDPNAIQPEPAVPDLRQQRRRFLQRVDDEGIGIFLARAANAYFDSAIPDWECRAACKFMEVPPEDWTDWEAYDCYRMCMGLPPSHTRRTFVPRAGQDAGWRRWCDD